MSRVLPLHPLFLAAYPVLWVYATNLGEVGPVDLAWPLTLAIGLAAALWL